MGREQDLRAVHAVSPAANVWCCLLPWNQTLININLAILPLQYQPYLSICSNHTPFLKPSPISNLTANLYSIIINTKPSSEPFVHRRIPPYLKLRTLPLHLARGGRTSMIQRERKLKGWNAATAEFGRSVDRSGADRHALSCIKDAKRKWQFFNSISLKVVFDHYHVSDGTFSWAASKSRGPYSWSTTWEFLFGGEHSGIKLRGNCCCCISDGRTRTLAYVSMSWGISDKDGGSGTGWCRKTRAVTWSVT